MVLYAYAILLRYARQKSLTIVFLIKNNPVGYSAKQSTKVLQNSQSNLSIKWQFINADNWLIWTLILFVNLYLNIVKQSYLSFF